VKASKVLTLAAALLLAFCCLARRADSVPAGRFDLASTASRKVALVVGNAGYQNKDDYLRNPVNDARLIGDALKKLGFSVIFKTDLTRADMKSAFDNFVGAINPGDVALFYYAGHGLQVGGKNYLLPVDFAPDKLETFWDIGSAMDEVSSKSGVNVVILDACRKPSAELLRKPNAEIGFTEFRTTSGGTYVAYSTSPGDVAEDGRGPNSPYAEALAKSLLIRPARIEDVFRLTQIEVERVTAAAYKADGGRGAKLAGGVVRNPHKYQVPWTSSSLKQVFFFAEDEVAKTPKPRPVFEGPLHASLTGGLLGGLKLFEFKTPLLNERGSVVQQTPGQARGFIEPLGEVGMQMIEIPGGRFSMGASAAEVGLALSQAKLAAEDGILEDESYQALAAEIPQHAVDVKGFYMSRYEITQAQYYAVTGRLPDVDEEVRDARMPVVNVTWQEANDFCARLSKLTGRSYRLPTEAEWEYAARAGTTTPFAFGETLNPQAAVYNSALPYLKAPRGAARQGPSRVGEITPPNAFGLLDMSGNVWEWVADYWHNGYDGAPKDGSAWDEPQTVYDEKEEENVLDQSRIVRGGSWFSPAASCRSAARFRFFPSTRGNNVGFRVVAE
jgi:formylglycine-generating enzyme required for sulfatase activity